MNEPVFIRSHTGVMVHLRLGMLAKNNGNGVVWVVDDYHFCQCCVEDCTMLHAPFVVGDECEYAISETPDDWLDGTITDTDLENMRKFPGDVIFRHADKNLRDAPDYKPEEKGV